MKLIWGNVDITLQLFVDVHKATEERTPITYDDKLQMVLTWQCFQIVLASTVVS